VFPLKCGGGAVASTSRQVARPPARKDSGGGLYVPAVGLLLRVTDRAWNEIGVDPADRWLPGPSDRASDGSPLEPPDVYVRTFWAKASQENALGGIAKPLHDIHPGLYRFSTGAEPRTIVWHDEDGGVVWLCAGLSFPDGDPRHTALYAEVKRLLANDRLLPTATEIEVARANRFWLGVMDELAYALRRAEQLPYEWTEADVISATGRELRYGAFYVEEEHIPGEGYMRVRHFIVLRQPPEDIPHPAAWQSIMIAELFPEGGPVKAVYAKGELPPGAPLGPDDIMMVHEIEIEDPDAEG
jgi:hypothetical protein